MGGQQQKRDRWNDALAGYADAQKAAQRSPGTINLHRHYLRNLADQHRSPWQITPRQLEQFLAREGWAAETRKSARAAVRGFYRWAHGIGLIEDDPSLTLPPVRVPAGVPRPVPEHVIRQLVRDEPDRVVFMALLAAEAGLRAGEIARVHESDYIAGELLVHGKGGKQRAIPIVSERLSTRLEGVAGWAFPNGRGSHLSPGHVSRLLSRALPLHWTAHPLRHRCGTVAYANTRDLFAVQQLLGHSRPETTQRYVQLPADAVRAAAAAAVVDSA